MERSGRGKSRSALFQTGRNVRLNFLNQRRAPPVDFGLGNGAATAGVERSISQKAFGCRKDVQFHQRLRVGRIGRQPVPAGLKLGGKFRLGLAGGEEGEDFVDGLDQMVQWRPPLCIRIYPGNRSQSRVSSTPFRWFFLYKLNPIPTFTQARQPFQPGGSSLPFFASGRRAIHVGLKGSRAFDLERRCRQWRR